MDDNDDISSFQHEEQQQEPNPVAAFEDSISVEDTAVDNGDGQDQDNTTTATIDTSDAVVTTAEDAQETLDKFSEQMHGQQYRRLREERLYQANSNLTLETAPSQPNPLAAVNEEGEEAKPSEDDSDQKLPATATATTTGAAELKQEIQLADAADADAAPPKQKKKHQRKPGRVSASYGSRTTIVETGQKRRSCICAHPRCNEIMIKWAKCSPSSYHYVQLPKLAGYDAHGNPTRAFSDTELYKNQFRLATLRYLKVKNPLPKDERIAVLHYHPEVREFLYWPKNTPAHSKYAIPRTLAEGLTNHPMDLERDRCQGLNQQDWCYVVPCYDFDTSTKEVLAFEAKFYQTVSEVKKNAGQFVRDYQALQELCSSLKKQVDEFKAEREQQHDVEAQEDDQNHPQQHAQAIAQAAGLHQQNNAVQQQQPLPHQQVQQQPPGPQPAWASPAPAGYQQQQAQQPQYYAAAPPPQGYATAQQQQQPPPPQEEYQQQQQPMAAAAPMQPQFANPQQQQFGGMDDSTSGVAAPPFAQLDPDMEGRPRKWPKRVHHPAPSSSQQQQGNGDNGNGNADDNGNDSANENGGTMV